MYKNHRMDPEEALKVMEIRRKFCDFQTRVIDENIEELAELEQHAAKRARQRSVLAEPTGYR